MSNEKGASVARDTVAAAGLHRRDILKAAAATATLAATGLKSPGVLAQAKPFAGTTLNVSCWSAPYPKFLAEYLPEFTAETGIKVTAVRLSSDGQRAWR